MKIKKKNVLKLYNLSKDVIYCKKCTISNQRPRITLIEKEFVQLVIIHFINKIIDYDKI